MDYEGSTASLERDSDLGTSPPSVVKRWLLELKLADKREQDWRKKSEKVWNRYRQKDSKKHSFNILWSNTETLRPAIYNSLPSPDVRRRFKDADPLGKACSEVLKRCLEYGLDTTEFDAVVKAVALDVLLPGRGVARVRYVPSLEQVGTPVHDEEAEQHGDEVLEGDAEEVTWEQAPVEHVQWDDFRISAGKEWSEVCWIAFRHRLTREELEHQFGELGTRCNLDATEDKDIEQERDEAIKDSFKTAEVWEIWDKDKQAVYFISEGLKESPLKVLADPMGLQGFFPIPRPVYSVEDSSSLVPTPLYELYREQAEELDRVSGRINVIINGLKMRGIYDATLSELSEVMRGQDNDLIPAQNVTALLERGGLEKAIWFLPIDQAAMVLKELYVQREQTKTVIYEITGVSDILRGSTNANETATAQQIKSNWGTTRLKRMQADISRFVRDLMRLQGEIIAEKFQPETIATMTGLKFPSGEEKQQALMQYQQQAMMAQQQGQQPPQPPQLPPSWDEVLQVLRDDKQRTFKVDIETDSTIAASVETDMQAMQQLLAGVVQLVQGFGPAVQMGAMPVEAVKEIILAVTRRAKLGNAVEDALDGIKQPPPQQQQQDNSLQVEQMKQQAEAQKVQAEQQHTAAMEQAKLQHQGQLEQMKQQHTAALEQQKQAHAERLAQQQMEYDKWKAELDAETKIVVAQMSAETSLQSAQMSADTTLKTAAMQPAKPEQQDTVEKPTVSTNDALAVAIEGFTAAIGEMRRPKTIVRDQNGRASGVQ